MSRASSLGLTAAPHRGLVALTLLLFVSGALALVYEVVWQRQFALLFGSAAPATAAVLAAYFAGLGIGSLSLGRVAARWQRPLRVYAVLEILIGVGALLVTPLLEQLEVLYRAVISDATEGSGVGMLAARMSIALGATLVPTFCMGGTLPVLSEWMDRGRDRLGQTAGRLYVANTGGAALGAVAVPFLWLPMLGVEGTVWTAAFGNFAVAAVAWWLDSLDRTASDARSPIEKPSSNATQRGSSGIVMLATLSGIISFALQVVWNRAFAQIHENSMHSFAVIVAIVILGLSVGAQLARIALGHEIAPRKLLGIAWSVAGLAIMAGPWLFLWWSDGLAYQTRGDSWLAQLAGLAILGAAICFVPTTLLAIALPALMEHAGRESPDVAGRVLGRLLAFNIAGSVVGALLAGFVLSSTVGLWGSLVGLGALTFSAGVSAGWSGANRWIAIAFAVCGSWMGIVWQPSRVRLASDAGERLIALEEGAHGIVAVVEREGSRRLKLNNHYALGGTAAIGDERMQAHVPLLLHANPKAVAFLGVGTGVTAGGAMFHPVEKITAVELVPEVIEAARMHFSDANAGLLREARVEVVEDDARHFLARTEQKFDVIIGDLVVPWRAGEGALFTREQFVAALAALAPDGVFCQWLPLFQLSKEELNILVRTYLSVFPNAHVWRGDFSPTEPAIALVGARSRLELGADIVRQRMASMRSDSANTHIAAPGAFWMQYVGELTAEDLPSNDKRLNTENHPWVELLGPRLHGGRGEALFVGRKLEAWLATIRANSAAEIATLPAGERDAVAAGVEMAELVLCVSEGDRAGAMRAHEALRRLLPDETLGALFP